MKEEITKEETPSKMDMQEDDIKEPLDSTVKEDLNEKIKKHVIHPLLSPTKSTRLTLGSRVIILGTDNVEQRVPQYVGQEAEIVVVPVHPATWFKVKFDNGKIVTFRPSALRLVSDGITVDDNYVPPPKKPKTSHRPRSNSLKSDSHSLSVSVPNDGNMKLLTSIHADLWPGCKVRILSGRLTGHGAKVITSGNGWVQLESSYGELAKRATELELITNENDSSQTDTVSELPKSSSATMRPVLQRRRSNSEPGSPTEISNRRNEFSRKNYVRKERKEMDLQRDYVQRYVDKQQAKIGTRPDLKYWLHRIQGSMVDPTFERNVSRDVRNHFCHSCYMEMWSGSKYCWNELCSSSPVYWKLNPNAREEANPLVRYRNAAANANSSTPLSVEVLEDSAYACEVLLSLRSDIALPKVYGPNEKTTVSFGEEKISGHKRKVLDDSKSKRSDSSNTDCEDVNEDIMNISQHQPSSLKLKIRMSPAPSPSKQGSIGSRQNSPRPNSTSPRLNFKRIRFRTGSPYASAQSAPPTAEEFARLVKQHEVEQQQLQQKQDHPHISSVTKEIPSSGPLPGLVSSQLPKHRESFNNLTENSPLLSSELNPDYPTNKAIIANVLPQSQNFSK